MLPLIVHQPRERLISFDLADDDPSQLVAARLRHSGYPFLWGLSCRFSQGVLSLSGTVPTFHLKQVAQELAMHTPGIREVRNEVNVTGSWRPAAPWCAAG